MIPFCSLLLALSVPGFAEFIPKYGPAGAPRAVLLRSDAAFARRSPAPDFWALIPYYAGMRDGHSASAASAATVLNALRRGVNYSSADELVTETALLAKLPAKDWADKLSGEKPAGVTLAELGELTRAALAAYGLADRKVEVVPATKEPAFRAKVRALLEENERTDADFLIARYQQSSFTGDPEGAVGTYSAVGAFDAKRGRVLVLETDRKYYEPYWVALDVFVEGLAALPDGGLLRVR